MAFINFTQNEEKINNNKRLGQKCDYIYNLEGLRYGV